MPRPVVPDRIKDPPPSSGTIPGDLFFSWPRHPSGRALNPSPVVALGGRLPGRGAPLRARCAATWVSPGEPCDDSGCAGSPRFTCMRRMALGGCWGAGRSWDVVGLPRNRPRRQLPPVAKNLGFGGHSPATVGIGQALRWRSKTPINPHKMAILLMKVDFTERHGQTSAWWLCEPQYVAERRAELGGGSTAVRRFGSGTQGAVGAQMTRPFVSSLCVFLNGVQDWRLKCGI